MNRERVQEVARHYHENGLKMMLENAANVEDTLRILEVKAVPNIDFTEMTVEPPHYVTPDYRHLESDIVLKAPLRLGKKGRARLITIYILIEHQSEPDAFMVFRALEYVIQIYKRQMRDWEREHGSLDGFRFQPVLPIVLYSGTRTWERLIPIAELLEEVEDLPKDPTPLFEPLFLNVQGTSEEALEGLGGAFGLLLRLVQLRRRKRAVFEKTLKKVVRELEKRIGESQRERWLDLLSFIFAVIYHEREPGEREPMQQLVTDSVKNDKRRQEVFAMRQTIAEALKEEGMAIGEAREALRSRRETLLRQLRVKFKRVPAGVVKRVESTTDVEQLNAWLDAIVTADKLPDVGIPPME